MKRFLYTALIVLFPFIVKSYALVAPHYLHENINCSSCHSWTSNPNPNATKASTNYGLCKQCHVIGGSNTLPFEDAFRNFTVGQSGEFHKWNIYTSNPAYGASAPTNPVLKAKIQGGQVVCSTCHDQHMGDVKLQNVGRQHKSRIKVINKVGNGSVSYDAPANAIPMGYIVEIVSDGEVGVARFKVSYTGAQRWVGGNAVWKPYSSYGDGHGGRLTGTNVPLDNVSNALITFTNGAPTPSFKTGDRWSFYIGYPYLRVYPDVGNNTTGRKLCRDCHAQRAQTHFVGGNKWDGNYKSHPVGVSLNSNGGGYDRKPLDVDGLQQGTTGANPTLKIRNSTNDLLLFQGITSMKVFGNISSGDVQCMTCHAPHWTDSNSRTKDRR